MPHRAKSDCDDVYSSTQSGILVTGSYDINLDAVDSDKWDSISVVPGTNLTPESSVGGDIGGRFFFWFFFWFLEHIALQQLQLDLQDSRTLFLI